MQHGPSRIDYWNGVAHEKHFSHPLRLELLAKYVNFETRILDYGCGYGRTLADLSSEGFGNIYGIDFSERMLARARLEVPGASLIRNDGRDLPFTNDSLDVVLLFAVLTCIPEDHSQKALLAEALRVVRPGGLVYVSDLLVNEDARNRERYERYAEAFGCYGVFQLPEGVVVRHHRREWIDELTESFEQLKFEPFTVTTMNGNASAAFQYLGRKRV